MNNVSRLLTLLGSILLGLFLFSILFGIQTAVGEPITIDYPAGHQQDSVPPENMCLLQGTPNLIQNPSFEGNYASYVPPETVDDCLFGVCQTAQIPEEGGWIPFWRSHDDNDPEYIIRQPEYKPACVGTDPCIFANRLRDGREALQYFTFFSTHEAGIMQTVTAEPGKSYCLSGWGHSWSAQDDDAISGPEDGELFQKVGIDPTGGSDWQSEDIIWSDADNHPWGRIQYDEYGLFTVTAKAQAAEMTIFLYSQASYAVKHNDVYWDDTHLSEIQAVYTTTLTTTADISVLTALTQTVQATQTVNLNLSGFGPSVNHRWSASVVTSTDGFTPTLSNDSGSIDDDLTIFVNTAGLEAGSYTADVLITTTPATTNAPFTIPVRVTVADKIYQVFLSQIVK
ncbi:MAG: hypothetical protein AB8G95_16300 [Anaerolineae bacterium]